MLSASLHQLVVENRPLFWSVPQSELGNINRESVVETILNFGSLKSVRQLFEVIGTDQVAKIFASQQSLKRNNYFPRVSHYFNLYFEAHVPKYSQFKSN